MTGEEDALTEFRTKGYTLGPRVLSDVDADAMADEVEHLVLDPAHPLHASIARGSGEPFLHVPRVQLQHPAFATLHAHPALVRQATALLGVDELQMFEWNLFYKPAREDRIRSWHQDTAYLPLIAPFKAIGVWVSLEGATAESGAMVMVPGSHRYGDLPPGLDRDLRPEALEMAGAPGDVEVRPVPKGFAHLHDPAVWHGSGGNASERGRTGLSLVLVERGTRFDASRPFSKFWEGVHGEPLDERRHPVCG